MNFVESDGTDRIVRARIPRNVSPENTSGNDIQPNREKAEVENPRWQLLNLNYLFLKIES